MLPQTLFPHWEQLEKKDTGAQKELPTLESSLLEAV